MRTTFAALKTFKACAALHIAVSMQDANAVPEERYSVVYKRPSDLALLRDVPVCCNLLICDMFDEGGSARPASCAMQA